MSSRIDYTLKNARWTILFSIVLLVLNFFSRSIFISHLGNELVGLTSVVTSYIGFLNLAELGIGTAITQALYKPVYENNQVKITQIVSLIGFLFRWVGIVITAGGLVLSCFLPAIFENSGIDTGYVFFAFGAMLFTTLLSYFANYKQTIVVATQRSYVITKIQNTILVIKVSLQMALLIWLDAGYISWLVLEILFGIFYAIWLEIYIKRNFGWLKTSLKLGKEVAKKEKGVFKNIRNIFFQSIAGKVLLQSDNIVIQNVISVVEVAYFTNYAMLMQRAVSLITSSLNNSHASVGNLIASNDHAKQKLVFWQYNTLFYWVAGIVAFGFYEFINPFINLWLTDKVLYSNATVLLLSFSLFISLIRRPSEYFLNGYGLFGDVWAAWTEMGLNLVLSIVLAINYGVIGVVIGTVVSTSLSTLIWKPYYLYSRGFKGCVGKLSGYFANTIKYIIVILICSIFCNYLSTLFIVELNNWKDLVIKVLIICPIFAVLSFMVFYITSSGMRTLSKLGVDIVRNRLAKKSSQKKGKQ